MNILISNKIKTLKMCKSRIKSQEKKKFPFQKEYFSRISTFYPF